MTIDTPPRHRPRWWRRYAVLECARGIETVWVISFHTFRFRAAMACGDRIAALTQQGTIGIYTCVMPADSGAVRQAYRTQRIKP